MTDSNTADTAGETVPTSVSRVRLREVDLVTAIAIALVVLGHVVAREPPANNEWYEDLKDGIYLFHMPLFMFCSGVVFQHTHRRLQSWAMWLAWSTSKVRRLAPGFVLLGVVITVGKVVAAEVVVVDNVETDIARGLAEVFIDPLKSAASSLWYIYVLVLFYVTVPLGLWASRQQVRTVLALGVVLHVIALSWTLPTLFTVNRYFEYLLYFSLGMVLHGSYRLAVDWCRRHRVLLGGIFVASFLVTSVLRDDVAKTIIGLASLPAMFGLASALPGAARRPLFFVASYTFTIYLMNTLAIGVAKGAGLLVVSWDGSAFLVYFPILFVIGLLGPIVVYRVLLSRVPILRMIMR